MMDVEPTLVANCQPAEAVDPSEGSLDDPSVATEPLAAIDASPCNARLDLPTVAGAAAAAMVIGLVGVQLIRPASGSAALSGNGWDRVEQTLERHTVVDVGPGQDKCERDTTAIRDQVTLGAGPASIRWIWPCGGSPLFAAMDELSMQARLQSIRSESRSCRSNSRCRRSHTPAACQSRSRLQHVTPDPHPISAGSISHGMPVRRTNKMPVSAARAGTEGRPPFGFGEGGGRSGSMISHSESDTRAAGIHSA
jgi:hypothetical protein